MENESDKPDQQDCADFGSHNYTIEELERIGFWSITSRFLYAILLFVLGSGITSMLLGGIGITVGGQVGIVVGLVLGFIAGATVAIRLLNRVLGDAYVGLQGRLILVGTISFFPALIAAFAVGIGTGLAKFVGRSFPEGFFYGLVAIALVVGSIASLLIWLAIVVAYGPSKRGYLEKFLKWQDMKRRHLA